MKSVLITGANGGLGKESARQLALQPNMERIYLGCRNYERAMQAKLSLKASTGRDIFEILLVDVSDLESVKAAVATLDHSIDGLIMNAGGMGGDEPAKLTKDGVTQMMATNVLGHVVLLNELLKAEKLNEVALYAGSEAARGVPKMMMKQPKLMNSSVDEFAAICDGSFFEKKFDPMEAYGYVKYVAAMWMASISREYPNVRIVTVSPGGTDGTDIFHTLPPLMRFIFTSFAVKIMPYFGLMHQLEVGAQRYVDVLRDKAFGSGLFFGSAAPVLTGPLIEQGSIFGDLNNESYQDNAREALHRFIK